MRMIRGLALTIGLAAVAVQAQDAPPSLTEAQQLKLRLFELQAENVALKMAQLQTQFAALQADTKAFLGTLQREGFRLERGEDGTWRYVAEPTAEPKP